MQSFQFDTTKRIINEVGGLASIAQYCRDLQISRPIVVSDQGIAALGLIDELCAHLKQANISCSVYDKTIADPPESVILAATQAAINADADGVIGLGGGSSMDCAKLVAALISEKQSLSECFGVDQIKHPRAPLILVPTTAGTGSEVTPISIVTTGETTKAGVVSHYLLPDIALLDASLTLDLPSKITAATGIDAMVHALEAYTSKIKKNPYSDMLALQALTLLSGSIHEAVNNGKNLPARQDMMLGACMAGQAFANAPVGAVHALAYPLGGHFHIPHGLSNSLVLPHVLRFNSYHASVLYAQVYKTIQGDLLFSGTDLQLSDYLADYFKTLASDFGLPTRLREMKVTEDDLAILATDAIGQQRLLVNNPREVRFEDALRIYERAY